MIADREAAGTELSPVRPLLRVLRRLQNSELLKCGRAVIQPDLLRDSTARHAQHRRPSKAHLATRTRGKRPDDEVVEGRTSVRPTAFPATDNIITLGDQVRSAPEVQIREGVAECGHERLDIVLAAARRVQRILQKDIRGSQFIDDSGVPGITPKLLEPATDDLLVVLC